MVSETFGEKNAYLLYKVAKNHVRGELDAGSWRGNETHLHKKATENTIKESNRKNITTFKRILLTYEKIKVI